MRQLALRRGGYEEYGKEYQGERKSKKKEYMAQKMNN